MSFLIYTIFDRTAKIDSFFVLQFASAADRQMQNSNGQSAAPDASPRSSTDKWLTAADEALDAGQTEILQQGEDGPFVQDSHIKAHELEQRHFVGSQRTQRFQFQFERKHWRPIDVASIIDARAGQPFEETGSPMCQIEAEIACDGTEEWQPRCVECQKVGQKGEKYRNAERQASIETASYEGHRRNQIENGARR